MRLMLRYILVVIALASALWFLRGTIFRAVVHYRVVGDRGAVRPLQNSTRAAMDLHTAIQAALDTTAARLHFSTGEVSNDPRALIHRGPANCIGYAALCAALLKGQLEEAGLDDRYGVEAVIGKLYVGHQDLHAFFTTPFWKDHDVVRVWDKGTGEVTLLDPTLYDHFGIGRVSSSSNL
jgi:hypothetical protein